MPQPEQSPPPLSTAPTGKRKRRWRRIAGFTALLLASITTALLLWINGPGIRWLGPRVAQHFLTQAEISGSFTLEGSITGGLTVKNLRLRGGPLDSLELDHLQPGYSLQSLRQRRLDLLHLRGLRVVMELPEKNQEDDPSEMPDFDQIAETIRSIRRQIVPMELRLEDIALDLRQAGEPWLTLEPTSLRQAANSGLFSLQLGALEWQNQRFETPATTLSWQETEIRCENIALADDLALENLLLSLPTSESPSLEANLRLAGAGLVINSSPGFSALSLNLREGSLDAARLAEWSGQELPLEGRLTSLSLELDNPLPIPLLATGELRMLWENLRWEQDEAEELGLEIRLENKLLLLQARAIHHSAEITVNSSTSVERGSPNAPDFQLIESNGSASLSNLPALLSGLASRLGLPEERAEFPNSSASADFQITYREGRPTRASSTLRILPQDPATTANLELQATWNHEAPLTATIRSPGLECSGAYSLGSQSYEANASLTAFESTPYRPWLAALGLDMPETARIEATWRGGGSLADEKHHGDGEIKQASWLSPDQPEITASGRFSYHWPERAQVMNWQAAREGHSLRLNAAMNENQAEISHLLWLDPEGRELVKGSGKLPLPLDFADWRELLRDAERPLDFQLESAELNAERLAVWAPEISEILPESSGKITLNLAGSWANPQVRAQLSATGIRPPDTPEIPAASINLRLQTTEGRAVFQGEIRAPDFPPATLLADMPFRPSSWAEDPDTLLKEPLNARVDLPRLDLSRFTPLIPALRSLGGSLRGNLIVAGTPAEPVWTGSLELENGSVDFTESGLPSLRNLRLSAEARPSAITLRSLRADAAGGSLEASGSLTLVDNAPAEIDLRLRGSELPVLRDEMLVIRTRADLRLQGPWERATLSGSVSLVDSLFYKDIELLPIGTPFLAPSAAELPKVDAAGTGMPEIPAPFNAWPLILSLRTEDPLLIRGNLARGSITADLRLGGTLGDPKPDGTVNIADFRASLPFTSLEIRRGALRFTPNGGFDPALEIRGRAEPRPYRVDLYVGGRLSDPQLVLTSNPPLPDNEIMTLLATGTTSSGLEDPQAATSRALQLLAEEIRRGRFPIAKPLRPALGLLDRIDFSLEESDPYSSDSFSTATLSLTDRWFLSAGMGEEGNTRVLAIWRLIFH